MEEEDDGGVRCFVSVLSRQGGRIGTVIGVRIGIGIGIGIGVGIGLGIGLGLGLGIGIDRDKDIFFFTSCV